MKDASLRGVEPMRTSASTYGNSVLLTVCVNANGQRIPVFVVLPTGGQRIKKRAKKVAQGDEEGGELGTLWDYATEIPIRMTGGDFVFFKHPTAATDLETQREYFRTVRFFVFVSSYATWERECCSTNCHRCFCRTSKRLRARRLCFATILPLTKTLTWWRLL